MIWEAFNCGSFLEKVYLTIRGNVLEISLQIFYERIYAFKTRGINSVKSAVDTDVRYKCFFYI